MVCFASGVPRVGTGQREDNAVPTVAGLARVCRDVQARIHLRQLEHLLAAQHVVVPDDDCVAVPLDGTCPALVNLENLLACLENAVHVVGARHQLSFEGRGSMFSTALIALACFALLHSALLHSYTFALLHCHTLYFLAKKVGSKN